jgi:hypothetical protein
MGEPEARASGFPGIKTGRSGWDAVNLLVANVFVR